MENILGFSSLPIPGPTKKVFIELTLKILQENERKVIEFQACPIGYVILIIPSLFDIVHFCCLSSTSADDTVHW